MTPSKPTKQDSFADFSGFVQGLLAEQGEGKWDDFVASAREKAAKHLSGDDLARFNSMYWNVLATMGEDASAHVTLNSVGGPEGLKQLLNQAHDRAAHCERIIKESLDANHLFVHMYKDRDATPEERYLEFKIDKSGSLVVLGAGGQGFVLLGSLKHLPYDTLDNFYNLLVTHSAGDEEARHKTATVTSGMRTKKEKAQKLHQAILNEWKVLFEKEGYAFDQERHFGAHVAVKVFPQHQLSGVATSEKEARFIGWPNPHVMPIMARGTAKNGVAVVIMPFIDMSEAVSPFQICRLFTLDDVVDLLSKVCSALAELHFEGLVHRDIKPDNILITREASADGTDREVLRPVITDFGLASIPEFTAYSISNTMKGTPRYLPPEQGIDSKRALPQSDIYALALWTYELLCGEIYNPPDEHLPGLINRIWRLSRGDVFHRPPVPSAHAHNIVHNDAARRAFKGLFGGFRRRAWHRAQLRRMRRLERVLAGMLITGNAQPVLDRCARMKDYQAKIAARHRLDYSDLSNEHKEAFIKAMVAPRYESMEAVVRDLGRIANDLDPVIPDFRRKLFTGVKGRLLLPWLVLGALGLAAAALAFAGKLGAVAGFVRGLF
ncbi:MAG: protein kinase [Planctomycetota bacterium]